ncbi:2-dehydro-3-deoxyphosphogluconate aldolase [Oceanobacillus arenosus]|uniref:2-dehydro-3-deoxyphosphogluconate aldolase n=1 Tax=Oceanobacillus arenosus TaxID=1229153 RepID=A0A3D8PZY9_9BACI|nr:bifunctional 4-hydroxy-2-oxoglutarate aldolase/2-dehydro-3-deoxy-phosphogluconate aldolase [Oceanobacillus arenosus]RDW21362.1 2-dehydro-3-deoxyphosphogluconate aldolase [Oceanobacillus arenosus]
MNLFDTLLEEKIIAILRNVPSSKVIPTAQALTDGGIKLLEITMNSEKALESIYQIRNIYDQDDVFIGAGTVLNKEMAEEAVEAGAQFLISPNLDTSVISYANKHNIDVWPGVMTPTEMVNAWNAGAKAVKLYPAGTLGPQYIKDIKAPLDNIPIIATGGINIENLETYFEAGADAIGVGGQLVQLKLIENNKFEDLEKLAEQFVKTITYGGLLHD